jgi:UDP-N-acetylglucosamine:LPS N-acetylglucosamine transferase
LEEKIVNEIAHYDGTATIVRGLPGSETLIPSTNMIKFYNHLSAHELNKEMLQAAYIVARSGYTTIMDVAALQKKSILIPTPGQTEQEYLADYLSQKKWAVSISQQNFKLKMMLDEASKLSYRKFENNANPMLKQVVTAFVESLIKP